MNRDDIIRMAVEAGGCTPEWNEFWELHEDALERFAALVAAAEREACITLVWNTPQADDEYVCHKDTITNAIRNRGGA